MIRMNTGPAKPDESEEYEIRSHEHVVSDPAVMAWRRDRLIEAGFHQSEAAALALRADVDVQKAVKWLREGATIEQILRILQPV